jgi:hypothetical protein
MDPHPSAQVTAPSDPAREQPIPAPQGLKFVVILMGVILIVGFLVVFITIGYRIANPPNTSSDDIKNGLSSFTTDITVGPKVIIEDLAFSGKRAVLTLREDDNSSELIVLDTERGRILGRFNLTTELR